MKFIKVDQELNNLKEKVKLQDPTKDIEVDNIKEKEIVPEQYKGLKGAGLGGSSAHTD